VFLNCADNLDTYFGECRRMRACVEDSTSTLDFLMRRIPLQNLRIVPNFTNVLKDEVCNVIGTDASMLAESLKVASPDSVVENTDIGRNVFTKEPLAMVTRPDDYEWTLLVETVLQGLLEAEARNITQATASNFPSVPYAGSEHERMVVQAVGSVGNFGELYNRTIGSQLPRVGLNRLRTDNNCEQHEGGLIYGRPFGRILEGDPLTQDGGGRIADILNRTKFRCGVPISRNSSILKTSQEDLPLFNVQICEAISAALFGRPGRVEIVPLVGSPEDAFVPLLEDKVDGKVDVIAGAGSIVLPMVGRTLKDYVLSRPYFYHPTEDGTTDAFVLATKSNDHEWSMFVQLIIDSVIVADEVSITQEDVLRFQSLSSVISTSEFVPESTIFGRSYDKIRMNVIRAVGNYQEIYERTVNATRSSSCNALNSAPHGPQHYPFLFEGL
jgi:hypothetical protein